MPITNILSLFILFNLSFVFINCNWETSYKEAASRSLQSDTDLILVPYPNNIFDKTIRDAITLSHYDPAILQKIATEYDLEEFDLNTYLHAETNIPGLVKKEVNYTSHYTQYNYDAEIPLWIYGPKWFYPGVYPDEIHQQHIPALYAKILNFPFLQGKDIKKYLKIFRNTLEKPKVIVTLVIDQGGNQLLKAHKEEFPFLKELQNDSSYFSKARVGHLEAHTVVGHMAIGTGVYPTESGIFSNEVYSIKDGNLFVRPVYRSKEKDWNLSEMKTPTLADLWDYQNDGESVIISQCFAARAAIAMAGHGKEYQPILPANSNYLTSAIDSDFVYWQDSKTLQWKTYEGAFSLPKSASKFGLWEYYLKNKKQSALNFDLKTFGELKEKLHTFQSSEYQIQMDRELLEQTILEEIVQKGKDKDNITDLVYVTFKATDSVGHLYGWESMEAKAILRETDYQISQLFKFLKEHYGDSFVLVITADHGAAPMPEVSGASYLTHEKFLDLLSTLLPQEIRKTESAVKWVSHSQLSLNKDILKKYNISMEDVKNFILKIEENKKPFFRKVWLREELPKPSLN